MAYLNLFVKYICTRKKEKLTATHGVNSLNKNEKERKANDVMPT